MSEIGNWESGRECERHEMAYCADCRDLAGIVRKRDGSLGFKADCAVSTFAEVTGADYEEAFDALKSAGYRVGRGTPENSIASAFEAAGYAARRSGLRIEGAVEASKTGRAFYVAGYKGRKAHAWSITEGRQNRPYFPPFRYSLYEVTA